MSFTGAPPTWQPRADLGQQFAPLSRNVQGYSQEEVERVMRAGTKIWRPRFELYDAIGNRVQPDLTGVTAATVKYDNGQAIHGSLEIEMLADERLRDAFMQFTVKPYAGVGPMPDGGIAEFPMGEYVWTKPERTITGTAESIFEPPGGRPENWKATLPDKLFYFDVDGPGDEPFTITAGVAVIWYLADVVENRLHEDGGGIQPTDVPVPADAWYTYVTTTKWVWNPGNDTTPGQMQPQSGQPETWLNIMNDLHGIAGYADPWYDITGLYRGQPDRAWWSDPADVIYDTADDGVMLLPVETKPDLKQIANRVKGWTQPDSGQQAVFGEVNTVAFQAIADLNDLLPQHPLAQVNTKRYVTAPLNQPTAGSYAELYAKCAEDLFNRLASWETMTLKRAGFLAQHDGSGIVGVKIRNDPEFRGGYTFAQLGFSRDDFELPGQNAVIPVTLFRETARSLDLMTGDGESTLTRLARTQP